MSDPVIRRLQCAATLYLEVGVDGLSLARVTIDLPIPPLPLADQESQEVKRDAAEALARWIRSEESESPPPAAPDLEAWSSSTSYGAWEVPA
jgi:hypothetical protein